MTDQRKLKCSANLGTRNAPADVIIVGGGPAGSTAAQKLAAEGWSVILLDKAGRIKPCGGAVPPKLIRDYQIPSQQIVARVKGARIVSPSGRVVDMPIEEGYVGMVDRDQFDEYLRDRAATEGAIRHTGKLIKIDRALWRINGTETPIIGAGFVGKDKQKQIVWAKRLIGADGALSTVRRLGAPELGTPKSVFAYHEVIEAPANDGCDRPYQADRCDIHYTGELSPDFYSWVFPHGNSVSVGTGTAKKGFSLRGAVEDLRAREKLDTRTIRCEGAPIPMQPLKRWDNGRDILLTGDAAGVVAPASGEGIYYAMLSGEFAAEAVADSLTRQSPKLMKQARARFMKEHGRVFWILGIMQRFWYGSDKMRERFTSMCADEDVQRLTWQAYMEKKLVRRSFKAHLRIFAKDVAHLLQMVSPYHDHDKSKT